MVDATEAGGPPSEGQRVIGQPRGRRQAPAAKSEARGRSAKRQTKKWSLVAVPACGQSARACQRRPPVAHVSRRAVSPFVATCLAPLPPNRPRRGRVEKQVACGRTASRPKRRTKGARISETCSFPSKSDRQSATPPPFVSVDSRPRLCPACLRFSLLTARGECKMQP